MAEIRKIYTNQTFYKSEAEARAFRPKRDELMRKYGALVEQACELTNVPLLVFQSLLMVENANSNPQTISHAGAVGLGQVTPPTAIDTIWREAYKKGGLRTGQIDVLRRRLDRRIDLFTGDAAPNVKGLQKMTLGGYYTHPGTRKSEKIDNLVTTQDLFDPEFNLLISAMLLAQLLHEETVYTALQPYVRLDRVIVRYNKSYFAKFSPLASADTLIRTEPVESGNYIKKMVGGTTGMMTALS